MDRILTDGSRVVVTYVRFMNAITHPQDRAAIVGLKSKFCGHRARPVLAHSAVPR